MAPLRIGLIGAGGNTRLRHIPGFRERDGVEIVAVANRSRESGQKVADEFGIPRVADSPEAIFADPEIDAVCIGTWPNMHRDLTVQALEAGKHVLCEARMAATLPEAEDMLAAHQAHPELVAQLVPAPFDFRLGPTIVRMINEGHLGDILEASVTVLNGSGLDRNAPLHWRQQRRYSGDNVMTFGIYVEVIHRWLGPTREVAAQGAIVVPERFDPERGETAAVDVPDTYRVIGRLERGATIGYHLSSVAAGATGNGISLYGSEGTLHWRPDDTATWARHGQERQEVTPDSGTDRGWRVETDFIDSIRDGAPVDLTSFEDGIAYMRVIDAAARSSREGRAVACGA